MVTVAEQRVGGKRGGGRTRGVGRRLGWRAERSHAGHAGRWTEGGTTAPFAVGLATKPGRRKSPVGAGHHASASAASLGHIMIHRMCVVARRTCVLVPAFMHGICAVWPMYCMIDALARAHASCFEFGVAHGDVCYCGLHRRPSSVARRAESCAVPHTPMCRNLSSSTRNYRMCFLNPPTARHARFWAVGAGWGVPCWRVYACKGNHASKLQGSNR